MKKILMSTTAIALIAASSVASAGDGLDLGIDGSIKTGLLFFNKDKTGDNAGVVTEANDSYSVKTSFSLNFSGTETFDNGIILGAKISFDTKESALTYDKVYMTLGYESIGNLYVGRGVDSAGDSFDYTVGSVAPSAFKPEFDKTKYAAPELDFGLSIGSDYKPVVASFVSSSFMGLSVAASFQNPTSTSGATSVVSDDFKKKFFKVDGVATGKASEAVTEGIDDAEFAYASSATSDGTNTGTSVGIEFANKDDFTGADNIAGSTTTFGTKIYRKDIHKAIEVPVDPTNVIEGAAGISYSFGDIAFNIGGGYARKGYKSLAAEETFGIDAKLKHDQDDATKATHTKALAKEFGKYLVAKTSDTLFFASGSVEYQGIVLGGGFSQLDTKSAFVTDKGATFDHDAKSETDKVTVVDPVGQRSRNFEVGAKYTLNALSFSVVYAQENVSKTGKQYEKVETKDSSGTKTTYQLAGGTSQTRTYGVSGAYKVVEGFDVGVDFAFYNSTSSLTTKKEKTISGWYGSLSTKISF